jgi:hypothetical protein
MGALASVVMSATTFAGSAQFAAGEVLGDPDSLGLDATLAARLLDLLVLQINSAGPSSRRSSAERSRSSSCPSPRPAFRSSRPRQDASSAGERGELESQLAGIVNMLAPALLAALVVTQAVGADRKLFCDERLFGIAAALVAIRLRATARHHRRRGGRDRTGPPPLSVASPLPG